MTTKLWIENRVGFKYERQLHPFLSLADEPSPTGSLISLDSLAETRQQTCAKALGTPESVNCSICALDSPNTEVSLRRTPIG